MTERQQGRPGDIGLNLIETTGDLELTLPPPAFFYLVWMTDPFNNTVLLSIFALLKNGKRPTGSPFKNHPLNKKERIF